MLSSSVGDVPYTLGSTNGVKEALEPPPLPPTPYCRPHTHTHTTQHSQSHVAMITREIK